MKYKTLINQIEGSIFKKIKNTRIDLEDTKGGCLSETYPFDIEDVIMETHYLWPSDWRKAYDSKRLG